MSAVSNSVMPRSIALWITLREVSRSVRWPKLLQPRPTAETRRPEPPRLRICMDGSCGRAQEGPALWPASLKPARRGYARAGRPGGYCSDIAWDILGRLADRYLADRYLLANMREEKMRPRSDAATDGGRFGARDLRRGA